MKFLLTDNSNNIDGVSVIGCLRDAHNMINSFANKRGNYPVILRWIGLILLNLIIANHAASSEVQDYEVKAMFLFYFSKFVDYPPSVLNNQTKFLRICIFGEDPFQKAIDLAVQGKEAHERPIEVKRLRSIDGTKDCQILFISSSERASLSQIFSYTRQHPILTVSDMDDFIENGGMIQFFVADSKVKFKVDLKKTQTANLKISSRLLQVAQVID